MDYNNLVGTVRDLHVSVVSFVGDRICLDIVDPGLEPWFLVRFGLGYNEYVCCLTRDCVVFRPIGWINGEESEWSLLAFRFIGDSVGGDLFWLDIGVRVREFVGKL